MIFLQGFNGVLQKSCVYQYWCIQHLVRPKSGKSALYKIQQRPRPALSPFEERVVWFLWIYMYIYYHRLVLPIIFFCLGLYLIHYINVPNIRYRHIKYMGVSEIFNYFSCLHIHEKDNAFDKTLFKTSLPRLCYMICFQFPYCMRV